MNPAVAQTYGQYGSFSYTGSQLAPFFAQDIARMSKRRRLDPSDEQSWEQQHSSQQPEQPVYDQQTLANVSSFGSNNPGPEYASDGTTGAGQHETAAVSSTVNESSTSTNATAHWPGFGSPSYRDVSSYSQQPYFLAETDPTTYNSSWPPAPQSSASFSQPSNYSVTAPVTSMPYIPPQYTAETSDSTYNAASTALQRYGRDVALVSQYGTTGSNPHQSTQASTTQVAGQPPATYLDDAGMHLKTQSLSILENLATQLIQTISKASYPQIQEIMQQQHHPTNGSNYHDDTTEDGQAYSTLKSLFDQTRKVYSRDTPFIDAIAIQMFQPQQQEVIRKANIATFITSILGAHDVSFFYLNEYFMETFVPLGHRLLKWQGAIYLELKTQTYISALINSDGSPESMLDELFPQDLDAQILTRHPDAPSLSPSEQDFIDRCRARRSYLLAEGATQEALRELPKRYQWQDFVREFATCVTKNVDGIMNIPARSTLPAFAGGGRNADEKKNNTAAAQAALTATSNQSGPGASNKSSGADVTADSIDGGPSSRSKPTASHHTTSSAVRQPWSKAEEDALLSGLARVNGPHWSQILALYGRGGSVSEVLKDRNQVQLKDKARNLKLWYLKMGKDVPAALRGVTGELRKRGGARARAALNLGAGVETLDGEAEGIGEVEDVAEQEDRTVGSVRGPRKR